MKKVLINLAFTTIAFLIICTGQSIVKAAEEETTTYDYKIDIVKDFVIDSKDLATLAKEYNKTSNSTGWNKNYDINNDGIIDIYDISILSKSLGKKITLEDNLYDFAEVGQNYTLQSSMKAKLGDKDYINLPIKWNGSPNTSTVGTYTYNGVIEGYNKPISFVLTVVPVNIDTNLNHWGFMTFDGNYIYYCNLFLEGGLYKANIDGSNPHKLNEDYAMSINYYNGWLYYINLYDNCIYKVKTDGTGRTLVDKGRFKQLRIYNGRLYCSEYNDEVVYSMKLDGTDKKVIIDNVYTELLTFVDNYVYYNNYDNVKYDYIYRLNLEDNSITTIKIKGAKWINVSEKYIFYADINNGTVYRADLDGSNILQLSSRLGYICHLSGDWLYYISAESDIRFHTLRRVKYDKSIDQKLFDLEIHAFVNIRAGRIYFYDVNGNLYSSKMDGTDIRPFN